MDQRDAISLLLHQDRNVKVLPASSCSSNFPLGTPLVTVWAAPSSFVHVTVAPLLTLSCAGVKAKPLAETAPLFAASGVPSLWIEIRSQEWCAGHRDEVGERVGP